MAALIPPSAKQRKPGLPSPRLEIPARASPSTSASGQSSSSGDDAESSGQSANTSHSSSAIQHNRKPSGSQSHKPKLSLFGIARSNQLAGSSGYASGINGSREDITIAPGFENMSLEDKTMKPGVINLSHHQQQHQSNTPQSSIAKQKPKLALGSVARTPSPLPGSLPRDAIASTSSGRNSSDNLSRSTSFEGALIAETSHVNVDGDDYKFSADTLQDLGRLGEGASGEVRKVLYKPKGLVVAKKVSTSARTKMPSEKEHADWLTLKSDDTGVTE